MIVPGFVNAHSHLEYAVYAGFGDGLGDFAEWITQHIQRKARIGWDEYIDIARLGAAQCLASGVTTVGDCSYSGATAVACAELGLRATVYLEVFGADPTAGLERFAELRERVEGSFSDRVKPGISPHAPYSVSLELYRACVELGLPVATHISESTSEVRYLLHGEGPWGGYRELLVDPPGTTGTRMLAANELLGPQVVAAHCVVLEPDEVELIASTGTGVAHCPRSNGALGCGVAPLAELRTAGARVGVGTDSPASAPSFDFFEELRSVLLSARARAQRPDVLSASQALELGTLGSARALRARRRGRLARPRQARRSHCDFTLGLGVSTLGGPGGRCGLRRNARPRDCDVRGRGTALREGRNGLARADRRRAQREARHARRPAGRQAGGSARVAENTMFFPRLRNQAKWAFVFLIIIFAGGFIFLGVGSGGLDLGQLLRDAFGQPGRVDRIDLEGAGERPCASEQPSRVPAARGRRGEEGRDGAGDRCAQPLHRPAPEGRRAPAASRRARSSPRLTAPSARPRSRRSASRRRPPATPLVPPRSESSGSPSARIRSATPCPQSWARSSSRRRRSTRPQLLRRWATYQKLVKLRPNDQATVFALAQAADTLQQTSVAVSAYKKLLTFDLDASTKAQIRERIRTLQQSPSG